MTTPSGHKHEFPMRIGLKGRAIDLRPLQAGDEKAMVSFAQSVPKHDLLFLQRDITDPADVDWCIAESLAGRLITIVAKSGDKIVGYATCDRGSVRWTRHVAEVRLIVAETVRGIGVGRLLLELVFEMALDEGVTKVIARMTPDQTEAERLFRRLGFGPEAVLRDHAMSENGQTHDLIVLSFHTKQHSNDRCVSCGAPVLSALFLDGARFCSQCYEDTFQELGGGG